MSLMMGFLCVLLVLRGFIMFGFDTSSLQRWMLNSIYCILGFDVLLKLF
jgi:hypothetical protein